MAATTTSYGFNTPTAGTEEDTWGGLQNDNWDDVDDILDGTTAIKSARMTTYNLTGTAINPDNGNVQYKTYSSNVTFSESFAEGDAVRLILTISGGASTNWPTMEWVGAAPSLGNAKHAIDLVKVNSVLIGSYLGPVS